jgi:hypothetical protein
MLTDRCSFGRKEMLSKYLTSSELVQKNNQTSCASSLGLEQLKNIELMAMTE